MTIYTGRGGSGSDPAIPECPVCHCYGGGGHGGCCPNSGKLPVDWTDEPPPGAIAPRPEGQITMTDLEDRAKLFAAAVTLERAARILSHRWQHSLDERYIKRAAKTQRFLEAEARRMRAEAEL